MKRLTVNNFKRGTGTVRPRAKSLLAYASLEPRCVLAANLILSEFMASNTTGLEDAYGQNHDWIEIHNNGDAAIDLIGHHLTDDPSNPAKWVFSASRVLGPNQYLVVFASSKNEIDPAGNFHTNFNLSASGEYIGLYSPNEVLLSQFGTSTQNYPPQVTDFSYGVTSSALISAQSPSRYLRPLNGNLGTTWTQTSFNAVTNGFSAGLSSLGYETQPNSANNFTSTILTSVPSGTTNLYVRNEFTLANAASINQLSLGLKYDDGFAVYLNGTFLFSRNANNGLAWNTTASAPHDDPLALQYQFFGLSGGAGSAGNFLNLLQNGTNVLAIHALNFSSSSSDFLISPLLTSNSLVGPSTYLATATPGAVNGNAITLGPEIENLNANGASIPAGQPLVVRARVTSFQNPVSTSSIQLKYRVMYGTEVTLAMNDNGTGGDAVAGDQIYSATIPGSAMVAGQMVRWYFNASDTSSNLSRAPRFLKPLDSSQYFGAVVTNPAINTDLPLLQWFLESPSAADSAGGTRASLFMSGELYDNVQVDIHGQSTQSFPKKSYDFDANSGEKFWVSNKIGRSSDFNLLTNYADQAKIRHPMAYDVYEQARHPGLTGHHVTLYRNGAFYGLYDVIEEGGTEFLDRVGLDPLGALYKINNAMTSSTSSVEKKSRKWEGNSDLQLVVNGNSLTGTAAATWDFDNLDLAALINNLAIHTVIGNSDFGHKNMYWFHDNDGTGLWSALPWDQDLSFGHYWNNQYFDNTLFTNTPLTHAGNVGGNNIYARVYTNPTTAAMYWRRLRSLTDQIYGTSSTNLQDTYIYQQAQIRRLATQDEAVTDMNLWGLHPNFAAAYPFNPGQAVDQIQNNYIVGRRNFITADSRTPASQTGTPNVVFDTVNYDANPVSGLQTEEYVRLNNSSSTAVDISGWQLRGSISHTFKGGTVIPANGTLYVVRDVKAFQARAVGPRGGQQLLIQGNYSGELSNLGATVTLHTPNNTLVHTLNIPAGNQTPNQQFLRISEFNYNPHSSVANAEFIEFMNTGSTSLNLAGVRITEGPGTPFVFANGTTLGPGQRILVVQDISNFLAKYPSVNASQIAGIYTGSLSNAGENIRVEEPGGELILEVEYADNDPWFPATDGDGLTVELINETTTSLSRFGKFYSWRASQTFNGTPGQPSSSPIPNVVINEIMSHTDLPQLDSIELFNPTSQAILIGGLYLSDSAANLLKYQIPPGTVIPANGYVVFDESHFNPTPTNPLPNHFSLNAAEGDDVWLTAATNGIATRVWAQVSFGATLNGHTLARFPNGTGRLLPSLNPSLGEANGENQAGPIIISEFNYNPALPTPAALAILPTLTRSQLEYIELKNPTLQTVSLTNWRLRGQLDYSFTTGTTMAPGETIVVVKFDPMLAANSSLLSAFRTQYGIGPSVRLVGSPIITNLSDSSGRISLQRPDSPPTNNPTLTPRILADEVVYDDLPAWANADGNGLSLQRVSAGQAGTLSTNWLAAAPTLGAAAVAPSTWTRGLFYNNSRLDGSPSNNAIDDAALATNKRFLINGTTATFNNYSSYVHGINGLMIDVFGLASAPTISNFQFRVGNTDDTSTWVTARNPLSVTVRPGAGVAGADRIAIVWADGTIVNQWLQVTLTINNVPDVFYFGNAIGETGNSSSNAIVNWSDVVRTQSNLTSNAGGQNIYDFNRDNRVDNQDVTIVGRNDSRLAPLRLITPFSANRNSSRGGSGKSDPTGGPAKNSPLMVSGNSSFPEKSRSVRQLSGAVSSSGSPEGEFFGQRESAQSLTSILKSSISREPAENKRLSETVESVTVRSLDARTEIVAEDLESKLSEKRPVASWIENSKPLARLKGSRKLDVVFSEWF